MLHEPVGNMESVIRKLERFELPKSLLLHTYQNILKAQLRYELKLNEKAFFHKDMHEDEIKLLHIRNQKIRQAESYLKKSEAKQSPELDILKSAAIYFHCPVPQTHEYMNGETALTFSDEPDLFSLTNLVTTLEPLARQKDANPQFVKYFSNLQQKKSQVLLDESLRNSLRQGIIGIKLPKVRIDLLHENLPKIHVSRPNLTGIVRDYVTVGSNVSQYDKRFLKETLIDDTKSFLLNTKLFKTNYKNSTDITSQLSALVKKIDRVDYVIGANEINEFINLTKDHSYFQPDKNLVQINVLIEDTGGLNFDSIRTKKAQKKMNSLYILSQLVSLGSGGIYNQHQKFAETMNHYLSQADGDPLRPYQAISSVVGLGQQFLEHQGRDPTQTALTYLESPDHVRPVASYLLYDYFESLQNFPEKDRERLVGKATDFITEVATRYQLKDDPNHDSLAKYLTTISEDPEMQDLLGYTVLPFLAYAAENEDSFARDQWLNNASVLIQKKEYTKLLPILDKAFMLISSYDPDNIKINFDNPSSMQANGETIVIPQNITDALNALPPNPNYLPPEQFMDASQKSYIDTWHSIYGIDSKPPQIYWDPVKEQPTYVNQNFRYLIDSSLNRNKNNNNIYYFLGENIPWFEKFLMYSPNKFSEYYNNIPQDDSYHSKFADQKGFLLYFQDYTHFIQAHATPENPMSESDLFAYALVKCSGNYTQATQEIAMAYKLMARYDIESGNSVGGDEQFFRTRFLDINLPILLSISNQTIRTQDLNKVVPLLLKLDNRLIDQKDESGNSAGIELKMAYAFGSKDIDLAELFGIFYHIWAQKALVSAGIANPSAIAVLHSIGELPFWVSKNGLLNRHENSSNKTAAIAMAGMDLIQERHLLEPYLKKINLSETASPLPIK